MQKKADEEIRRERNIPEPQVITQPDEPKPHVVKEGFPLYLETQKPIYGSLIRTGNLQSLIDVGIESGAVTVWGEVFSLEVRTTRDGKNNIINFNIYTAFNSLSNKDWFNIKQIVLRVFCKCLCYR